MSTTNTKRRTIVQEFPNRNAIFHTLFLIAILNFGLTQPLRAQDPPATEKPAKVITQLHLDGPKVLNYGPNLIKVWAQYDGSKRWRQAKPEEYDLKIDGSAKIIPDISQQPVNPFTLSANADEQLTVTASAIVGDVETEKKFKASELQSRRTLSLSIDPDANSHEFTGTGAGAMFYDNQFTIDNILFDWCFKDVNTEVLHILIRPDFEPVNDNDDWQVLDNEAFDWAACERIFWICWHAKQRNPDLKIYACLYSPPSWMKANDDTVGDAGLKEGEHSRLEMAEYVYAFLKHAEWKGTVIDYLCLFNEPDFAHSQDGNYIKSLTELAKTQAFVSEKVDQLIAADPDFDHQPKYVFPETLGPGSITRAGEQTIELAKLAEEGLLDHLAAWGVHDYWNSGDNYWNRRYQELKDFPGVDQRPIWMTEWAQRYPRGDLASAMEYSENMLNALRLGASAWMAFEWAHPAPSQSGLISTHWGEDIPEKRFWRSKSYYAFRQISNTSPAGGEVLKTKSVINEKTDGGSVETLVIRKDDQLVVHLLNSENRPLEYQLNWQGDAVLELKSMRRTSPSENDQSIESPEPETDKPQKIPPYT